MAALGFLFSTALCRLHAPLAVRRPEITIHSGDSGRAPKSALLLVACGLEQSRARLEIAAAALVDFLGGFLLLVLQIGQIRLAEGAADGLEVELDVALLVLGEHAQQEAAELLAARTAQAM